MEVVGVRARFVEGGDFAYHRLEFGRRRAHELQAMETRPWKPPCWAKSSREGVKLELK